jgi:hypothetical protein
VGATGAQTEAAHPAGRDLRVGVPLRRREDGPTPSINEIAVHFKLNYKTVYYHVMKLIIEGRLRQERGKLVVVGSEWIEPVGWPVQQRFDF